MSEDARDLLHQPSQPTATRSVQGRTELGDITVETGPPPKKVRAGGGDTQLAALAEKANNLVAPQWLRVPVLPVEGEDRAKTTLRALTAVRRVIREKFGKVSDGCKIKATEIGDGDIMIQKF